MLLFNVSLAWAESVDFTFTVSGTGNSGTQIPAGMLWSFGILAGLTVLGSVATVTRRNPVTAVMCLIGTLFSSAGIFLLLHATFMAAIQVLVYAGAIMVLFIMVVMAVEQPDKEEFGIWRTPISKAVGIVAIGFFIFRIVMIFKDADLKHPGIVPEHFGDVTSMGRLLFSNYLFPFEVISILLLAAILGAVAVSRRRVKRVED